jgi:hypothetical protein
MKQNIFRRAFVIILFLFASIAIKSETCCISKFDCLLKKNVQSEILSQPNVFPLFASDEGFLIKI